LLIISLFDKFECKCEKTVQKVKTYFLPLSIILRLIPIEIPKKYKNEPPTTKVSWALLYPHDIIGCFYVMVSYISFVYDVTLYELEST
jgi:hypothetical protein